MNPRPPAPARLALLALLALAALPGAARAVDVQSDAAVVSTKSLGDYIEDLSGDSDPDRLFAARVLRGELKRALRVEARAAEGSLTQLDARALLVELGARLPDACSAAVRFKNTVEPCADILAMLEVRGALPILREILANETRKGARKHLEAAIAALEALPPEPVPAVPSPPPPAVTTDPAVPVPGLPPFVPPTPDGGPTPEPAPAPGGAP